MSWPPETKAEYERINGFDVYSKDGEKLGFVDHMMHPDYPDFEQARGNYVFVVKAGFVPKQLGVGVLGSELYIPESDIQSSGEDHLILNMDASEFEKKHYEHMPSGPYVLR